MAPFAFTASLTAVAAHEYKQSLCNSDFSENINCLSHSTTYAPNNRKKKRSRNIIWFNPPFSNSVSNNIGKESFSLLVKHFFPSSRLHKKLTNKVSISVTAVWLICKKSLPIITSVRSTSQHQKKEERLPATAVIRQTALLMAFAAKNPSFIRHQSIHQMSRQ